MPENNIFLPEGLRPREWMPLPALRAAMEQRTVLEGVVLRCGADHTLRVSLGAFEGVIPPGEALAPWISGANREIALLALVGKPVCFLITDIQIDEKGSAQITLSRRAVQEAAKAWFLEHLRPGAVMTVRVTHLDSFGAFVDIGCGIIAMLPIENISVSRIPHPAERFHVGQKLLAAVAAIDPAIPRFTMTHRELLGTWMENASRFQPGETVPGIVRSVRDYGCFIELTPNLSGLADRKAGIGEGDRVSVYLKSIRPERMKIKLQIIEKLPPDAPVPQLTYQITDGVLECWTYSPPNYEKEPVETVFTASP
ncbi:MAG: S1 RNA-binding domain-containing protein [Oscillibacter sp.]|jgi:small subunit ribosomal protein S1|nr:S1 RNA-binding domain-containing protein [Oscillibacter sp.]